MLAPAISFVDVETTGTTPTGDRITEIGIVRVEDGELIEEWSSLVNPQCSIPEDIQALTGISNAMVRDAPTFAELRREVLERLEGRLFVAHNARFDYGFIKNEFRRAEIAFTAEVLCTVRLSRKLYPDAIGHSLDAIIARHGLEDAVAADPAPDIAGASPPRRTGRHSALGDARVLWRFVQRIYREKEIADIAA
ncbi:MAG: 3'-5' exonuclease, partial [Usitatibacter sp.]